MRVSFCFSGWVNDFELKTVLMTETHEDMAVEGLTVEELQEWLDSGKVLLSLRDILNESDNCEIEISDVEVKTL